MNKFPQRLRELREEQRLTQTQLAKMTGSSQAAIAKWESGSRTPTIDFLIPLTRVLGCTSDYLIGIDDFSEK